MKMVRSFFAAAALLFAIVNNAASQCQTWNDSPRKSEAEDAHVIYRPYLKGKEVADLEKMDDANFNIAFDNWKKAYEIAPAADGQRPSHYSDGRLLYRAQMARTKDEAKKKEFAATVLRLYDEEIQCYKNEAVLLGRKGYDMFYYLGYGYSTETFDVFKKALAKGGKDSEYVILEPMAEVVVYLYQQKKLTKEEVRDIHAKLTECGEHNIKTNTRYGQYYKDALTRMDAPFRKIEDEIFDCAFFKEKLLPIFNEHPDSIDVVKYIYVKLRQQGCDSTDTDLVAVRLKYEALASAYNAEVEAKLRKDNPAYDANKLYEEGKYSEALSRYREAIENETDATKKGDYYYRIATIQFRELRNFDSARDNARKAASLKTGWGPPYILIGDMYLSSSRNCGDDWNQRLAVLAAIDKYSYARSIDSEVADDANRRIGNCSGSLPSFEDGHMRGIKEGQTATVGCWIGETVRIRFNK